MPQAVHGEAIHLLDPDLELLRRAELVQLVRGVDLAEKPAELVVTSVVLQPHFGGEDTCRALHHARQEPCSILLLLEEGPPQGREEHQALQAELCAVRPLVGTTPGEEVEEGLHYALIPQHVPTVRHHDSALLVGRLVGDGAHEVEGEAIADELQNLLHEPALLVLVGDVYLPAVHLSQRLNADGKDVRQGGVPEAERRPPEPGHRRPYGGLHVRGEIRVDLQPHDPVQGRGLQELTHVLGHVLELRAL
mmetsp:Transcript_38866/g.88385  ORF Transcript_38866/g.88385 Transcript_38866/m.88385 type:complete len:249 (-) Transcript_38866:397-1143(-)